MALLRGKPMIQHVYQQTCQVPGVDRVMVATDDERIAAAVRAVGGQVAMTRADHPTGTDRLAEVAAGLRADLIVNVQGDLPFFPAGHGRGRGERARTQPGRSHGNGQDADSQP